MTTDKDPSRAAFEAWYFGEKAPSINLAKEANGNYVWRMAQAAWDVWQASREQALTEAAQACDATAICHAMALLNREAGNAQGARNCATTIRSLK